MAPCPSLREEFRLAKFGFGGIKAERFCFSQWRLPVAVYMLYRFLLMGYGVIWLGYISIFRGTPPQAWGAYLTIWTYILLNIYLIVHFLAALAYHVLTLTYRHHMGRVSEYLFKIPSVDSHARMFGEIGQGIQSRTDYDDIPGSVVGVEIVPSSRPPLYICLVGVLFNVVSSAAFMVTIVFFTFLFPGLAEYPHINLENLQEHLLNSVIIVLEHLVSAAPYRLLHVVYPFIYGLIYMFFSVIYWAGDHSRVMYPNILDWNKPGPTVGYVFLIGFVFIPILHIFFFLVHKLKMAIYKGCCAREEDI